MAARIRVADLEIIWQNALIIGFRLLNPAEAKKNRPPHMMDHCALDVSVARLMLNWVRNRRKMKIANAVDMISALKGLNLSFSP